MKLASLALLGAWLAAAPAFAGDARPQHGGRVVDAGDYHVEMVSKDGAIDIYVSDHDNRPLQTKGYRAVAILSAGGKSQRIVLDAADGSRLSGKAEAALPAQPKGVVQITSPAGKTVQARFD